MSTPNPLIPQGTFQAQAAKNATNVRIAVVTIVAIHVVFFGGLLLQGCKREPKLAAAAETNAATQLTLPPIDPMFYQTSNQLPQDSAAAPAPASAARLADALAPATNAARDPWRASNLAAPAPSAPAEPAGMYKEYTIVRGDSFSKIAAAHGTTVNALRKANPEMDPMKIRPGMKVQIPPPAPAAAAPSPAGSGASGNVYVVKAGDTLTQVARNHGVTVSDLRAANNLRTSGLRVGQKLTIPAGRTNAAAREAASQPGI